MAYLLFASFATPVAAQTPTGTAFTYQGRLVDGGAPASGSRDFSFALYDAETDGAQIGAPVALSSVPVAGGLFTVELDFGPGPFGAEARWLQIAVGPEGGPLTVLAPRQKLTPTPVAIHAARASTLDVTAEAGTSVVNALNSVSTTGTLDPARLPAVFARRDQPNLFTAGDTPLRIRPATPAPPDVPMLTVEDAAGPVQFRVDAEGDLFARSLLAATQGGTVTFIAEARPSSTGLWNLFAGARAGRANTTGDGNVFLGTGAGEANTTAVANTFVGRESGLSNTTGASNTFLGHQAGAANTTGGDNTFVGTSAGFNSSSGGRNTLVGTGAGFNNTSGHNNTFVGSEAGVANTTGNSNVFVGISTGRANVSGTGNTFIGVHAGSANTVRTNNTFVGSWSGFNSSGGAANTMVGATAGFNTTSGSDNTLLGTSTGLQMTTGDKNTLVGALADSAPGLTNATAIGAGALVTQSDSVVLGANARVGIKESAPVEELHIGGNGTIALEPRTTNPAGTPGVYKLYIFQSGSAVQLRIVSPSGNVHQIATITQ